MEVFASPVNRCVILSYGQVFYCPLQAFYVSALYSSPSHHLLSPCLNEMRIASLQCSVTGLGHTLNTLQNNTPLCFSIVSFLHVLCLFSFSLYSLSALFSSTATHSFAIRKQTFFKLCWHRASVLACLSLMYNIN